MPKVEFKYNINNDAWSWVSIAKDKNLWGLDWNSQVSFIPKNLLKKIIDIEFLEAQKLVREYLESHPLKAHRSNVVDKTIISLKGIWRTVENNFFSNLSSLTKKEIYRDDFDCFLTTGFMCIDNAEKDWFMISVWHSLPFSLTSICHELSHLHFLHHYQAYLKKSGLNGEEIDNLKESLTFLLNESEFSKIILVEDIGYPEHFLLREKLKNIWRANKDFDNLLEKAIEIIK